MRAEDHNLEDVGKSNGIYAFAQAALAGVRFLHCFFGLDMDGCLLSPILSNRPINCGNDTYDETNDMRSRLTSKQDKDTTELLARYQTM